MNWDAVVTHRQYQAWQAWLDIDMNDPGKIGSYLMQVAAEVRLTRPTKSPQRISLNDFKITFRRQGSPPIYQTREEAARAAKARWMPLFGLKTPEEETGESDAESTERR